MMEHKRLHRSVDNTTETASYDAIAVLIELVKGLNLAQDVN